MTAYPLIDNDLSIIREIHEKYYKEEFKLPDFKRNFPVVFKIVDSNGILITAGGVRYFPELILITDQEAEARKKYDALMLALGISQFHMRALGHDTLHASAPIGSAWEQVLINPKVGFKHTRDNNLVIY